ncbi:hypothetical protein B0H10DRAFT_1758562, partial [Mycena sp. CBHHK59/15]
LLRLFPFIFLAVRVLASSLPACPDRSQSQFDFVVVGSGVGGGPLAARLAENGVSVLLVDAGHDVVSFNTTIPFYFGRSVEVSRQLPADAQLEINYTYDEYSSGFKFRRNDSWYPRARGLAHTLKIHNAMVNSIGATEQDFENLAAMFNDSTWSYKNMRKYFDRIESNLYL